MSDEKMSGLSPEETNLLQSLWTTKKEEKHDLDLYVAFLGERGVTDDLKSASEETLQKIHRLVRGDHTRSISSDDGAAAALPTFDSEFNHFLRSHPEWNPGETYSFWDNLRARLLSKTPHKKPILFWTAHADLPKLKVLRRQLSGLCYIHAPVVLQHYLCCINSKGKCGSMIDVAKFVRDHFDSEALRSYVFEKKGGCSMQILKTITNQPYLDMISCELRTSPLYVKCRKNCERIAERLKTKPALVSGFRVDSDFQTSNKVSFRGLVGKDHRGLHAMLLIGAREDQSGEYWFLLQNWWTGRFFIEVNWQYLASSDCKISFVANTDDLTDIPDNFSLLNTDYAETSTDVEESLDEYELHVV